MNMTVCWNGNVTACGCADFEGEGLRIGNAERETLAGIWSGKKRATVLDSFGRGNPFPICRRCSGYTPETAFALPCFKGVQPNQPLPVHFYRYMVT
jgi:MoaA/NifB/PqqE/SkfB family radical SAM enzyme